MALTPEWRKRIDHWRRVLSELLYRPLGEVRLDGFTTKDQLTPAQAAGGDFQPMPPGTSWGGKWEYGWFRGEVTVPEEAEGERIQLHLEPGGAKLIYVNGVALGHDDVTLCTSAVPGTTYEILLEAYAGHGPTPCGGGPVPRGTEAVPEPPAEQHEVGTSTFGVFEEEAFQLFMDVETLYHLRESLDPDSLRVSEIDEALRDFTTIVDLELPREEMMVTVRAGRQRLRPLLECRNGSTVPTMFAFGHGHLDVAWLWPLAETNRRAARTLSKQLALAAEYPEHRFLHSQPELFERIKRHYPELWERVTEAVEAGTIIAEGSTWIEMDTNITGGESLIRQFIHGKRFFREEFGVETELLWLPDVFGYSGALPQIMRGCGVKYFSTAKIFWTYHGGDPFPHNTFTWEGIDGSKVLVHLCNNYGSQTRPGDVINRWRERRQKDGLWSRLFPFGWGDGGGGPDRRHLEYVRREEDLEGVPRMRLASPLEYFEDLEEGGVPDVNYVGELYYQCHRGTYTSQARTKRLNRRAELALREAEMWGTAAELLGPFDFGPQKLDEAWKSVLVNQFHDILPGSSIRRVYEEAEAALTASVETARAEATDAAGALLEPNEEALTVFNSLSWERAALVQLPPGFRGASDLAGEALPVQEIEGRTWAEVAVPSCGWRAVRASEPGQTDGGVSATGTSLENELLRVEFNGSGEVTSIFDKTAGREVGAGPCNRFKMYKDVPSAFDAWDIDSMYGATPVELAAEADVEVVSEGPLAGVLRIRRKLHSSEMVQEVWLRGGSRRIEFRTTVDWRERHKLLKVAFPVDVHASEGIHEIQFGHLRRPNHASRPFDADRFEVCNQRWTALAEEGRGAAVLNDCKYGVNVDGNVIALTLLKSPLAPDMHADRGEQQFIYAFTAWNGPLAESGLVREGWELNCPVTRGPGEAEARSLFELDSPNVMISTVKPAEDGSGDVVVRLYESMRTATTCELSTSLPVQCARETNMLEEGGAELPLEDGVIPLRFRPFEIKTVRLSV